MPIIGPRGNKPPASDMREASPRQDGDGEQWPDAPVPHRPQDRRHQEAPQQRTPEPEPEHGSQDPWEWSGDVLPGDVLPDWPAPRARQQQPGPNGPQAAPPSAPHDNAWEWVGDFGAPPPQPRTPAEPHSPVPVEPQRPVRKRKPRSRLQEALRRASEYDSGHWPEDVVFGRASGHPADAPQAAPSRGRPPAPARPHAPSQWSGDPGSPPQRRADPARPSQHDDRPQPPQIQRPRQLAPLDDAARWPDDQGMPARHDVREAAQPPSPAQPQLPPAPRPPQWPPHSAVPDNAAAWSDDFSKAPSREDAPHRGPQKPEVLRRVMPLPAEQDDPDPVSQDNPLAWLDGLGAPLSREETAWHELSEPTAVQPAIVVPSPAQAPGDPSEPQPASQDAPPPALEKPSALQPEGEAIRPRAAAKPEIHAEAADIRPNVTDQAEPAAAASGPAAVASAATPAPHPGESAARPPQPNIGARTVPKPPFSGHTAAMRLPAAGASPQADAEQRGDAAGARGPGNQPHAPQPRPAPAPPAQHAAPSRQGPQSPVPNDDAWQWPDNFLNQPQPEHRPAPRHPQDGAPRQHAAARQQQAPARAQRAPQPSPQDEWQWTEGPLAHPQEDGAPQPPPARPQTPHRPPHAQAPRQPAQGGQQRPQPPQSGLRRMQGAPSPREREIAPRQAPKAPPSRSRELAVRQPHPSAPRASRSRSLARRPGGRLDPQNVFDEALESVKKAAYTAGMFSLLANILMLGGPLFMLQVYDRVLTSGNIRTLVMLTLLLVVLYSAHGLLDMLRGQILNRIAGRIDNQLGPATLEALPKHRLATGRGVADEPLRDLATLRQFISGSGPAAFFDLPWAPLFLLAASLMHWALGLVTLVGMLVMVGIAVWNEIATKSLILEAKKATERANRLAIESGRNLEACVSMGMMDPIVMRWQMAQQRAEAANRQAGDRAAAFTSAAKTFRMFMQSMLLAVGALLVIKQQISSGTMFAVAVIGGQALGPLGNAVLYWRSLVNARDAFARLRTFHKRYPVEPRRFSLPAPKGRIEARNVQVTPPGAQFPVLRDVSFSLEAGEALGIIGASAAGKSTLARVMVGLWPPERGFVLLDGVDMRMWNRDELGPKIGYLPQTIDLFDGTIAQNISRFYPDATTERVFRAAERVGAHQMIMDMPNGYNFRIGENGSHLSAGQRQRIGLARAVYGDPVLVVLDEPNANLDGIGEAALHRALRTLKAARITVILVTHRTSALDAVDHILVLEKGAMRVFGEKAKVLQALTRNAGQYGQAAAAQQLTALPRNETKHDA